MKRWFTMSAVLLPLLVLAGWVIQLEQRRQVGAEALLTVEAYDPRDLLAGHYLQYRVDFGIPVCDGNDASLNGELCVCFNPTGNEVLTRAEFAGVCEAKPVGCSAFIRGHCEYQRFIAGIERFYIPEDYAPLLTQFPPNAQIKVRISSSGSAQVTDFLVGGEPLAEFVRKKR